MTSPRLAHRISGQEVIYKLFSLNSDGAIKMIHEHLYLIFGVFLLFGHEEECRVRSVNSWQQPLPTLSVNDHGDSASNAVSCHLTESLQ